MLVKEAVEDFVDSRRNSFLNDSSDSLSYRLDEPKDDLVPNQNSASSQDAKLNHVFDKRNVKSNQNATTKCIKNFGITKPKTSIKQKVASSNSKSKYNSPVKENNTLSDLHNNHVPHSTPNSSCIFTRSRSQESVRFRERILRSHTKKSPKFKNRFFTFENSVSKNQSSNMIPIKKNPSKCLNKTPKVKEPPSLDFAGMPNISVYSNHCSKANSRYNCRRSSLIMADPPVLTPIEIKNESSAFSAENTSESVEVKTNSNLCSQGCLKLTVRVRNNSTDSDHSTASDSIDIDQQFCNLHNDITVQSKGMVYEIIPVKCDGNHDANKSLLKKKMTASVSKSKKNIACSSAPETVNIRISSSCYSHSLNKEEPELSLDSPMKPGTKRVRLILGNDSIDIDIPPTKNRKCI